LTLRLRNRRILKYAAGISSTDTAISRFVADHVIDNRRARVG
jgi:hypothetical protein